MNYINPSAKLFQHMPTLELIKQGQRPAPVNVEIDLSNRCSLGCSWCHFAYTHTKGPLAGKAEKPQDAIAGGDLMPYLLAHRLLPELKEAGVKSITWTGGGEPTLHQRFDDIVTWAKLCGLEQGIYTHGGHLDTKCITEIPATRAELIKKIFTWVYVSLDECTPEAYHASKGVSRFEAAVSGIRRLVEAEGKATVGVGFLLHPGNWREIHSMVKLGRSLGVDYVQFRPTVHFRQDAPGELAEDTSWMTSALGHLNVYARDSFVQADVQRFEMYQHWQGHGYSTCFWSALQTVITPNGKVWRCANKREHPSALLGDLSIESFAEIWARSGGPCEVDAKCRVMCRGHLANVTLDKLMQPQVHANFI